MSLLEKYKFGKFVKILKRWKHPNTVWNSIWNRTLFIPIDSGITKKMMNTMLFTFSSNQFIDTFEFLMLPKMVKTKYFLNNDLYSTTSKYPMKMRINLYSNVSLTCIKDECNFTIDSIPEWNIQPNENKYQYGNNELRSNR